ncbi:MAG: RadC family protein, partial [Candidatus Sumerlaeia bacterium]
FLSESSNMDKIQLVDCFERLNQHLLKSQPDLQNRIDGHEPYAYRSENMQFFMSHLIALLTGIDDTTAEGKRRIRKMILAFDASPKKEVVGRHLTIRDGDRKLHKELTKRQKALLGESFENLSKLLEDRLSASADSGSAPGMAFDLEMDRHDYLSRRIQHVCKLLPCLSTLNAFRFLSRIGYPVLVPDRPCQNFLFRLGLISETGSRNSIYFDVCTKGEEITQSLKRSLGELNIWIQAFVGSLGDLNPLTALCRHKPDCPHCPLQNYCAYYRFNRPRAQGGEQGLSIRQWSSSEKPRERLEQLGAGNLKDSELLAIILRTGSGKMNVIDLAHRLLERFKTLQGIEEASIEELQKLPGIGKMKAIELKAVFEIGRRQAYKPFRPGDSIHSADDVFRSYRGRYEQVKQEEFLLLMLNNKNQVIREEVVSRGGLDMSIVHPREVFKAAIRASAASVIFVHNHPSGSPEPSHDDYVVTQRLEEAADLLQIRVLDHIIIGADSYYSFTEGEQVTPEK